MSSKIVSTASDGEAHRGKSLVILAMCNLLPDSSPITPTLKPLELMNFLVGEEDVTADKDFRHVDKWIRNLLLCMLLGMKQSHLQSFANTSVRPDIQLTT
jgi:hypothetical protein